MVDVWDVPMRGNDAGAETVGDYLLALTRAVWRQEQGFSGKRPFGESSWQYQIYVALAEAGVIEGEWVVEFEGTVDEFVDWDVSQAERRKADKLIDDAIRERMSSA